MEQLKHMAVFATVVDCGSMVGAAEVLGMTPSAVSQQIRKLEDNTKVSLLHRTTRKLTLTEAGASFYESCAQVLALANEAQQRLAELRDAPVGELRITTPAGFAGAQLGRALAPLLRLHPGLRLKVLVHDEQLDLVEQRIDLAIRVGQMDDSSLVARHIGDTRLLFCVAPSYLHHKAPISRPEDLLSCDWLSLNDDGGYTQLHLQGPQQQTSKLRLESRIGCNNIIAIRELTLAGMGVSLQPEDEVRHLLANGSLQVLLADWQLPPMGVYLVTPRREAQPAKVRYAIEALRKHLLSN
ncbi:LysR family transcriptional regulator [Pseudomonas sp. 5P_3.1_Bac2]|uniref:LysR family transcriptional regulator n=1 Tax=Pseudomonas sp. 5P_3.1_Bac2 TaxID=2971617 RepID=UPI0021CA7017|nr:LysR family transcriptional regulator [Pseudomonas sp. 5P_3.1_Bac2]MCU1718231.1 LysR family transcriptional regulator [Pseudomonas sp. 5P_3.1_Bac2]